MSSFNELMVAIKYANLLSNRLEKFHIKRSHPYLANFRCCYCGDSSKSKSKMRGYIYQSNNTLGFKCHNGCAGKPFGKFLEDQDPFLYKEYLYETFEERRGPRKKAFVAEPVKTVITQVESPLDGLKRISELKETHPARRYVDDRQLPEYASDILYFAPSFAKYVNNLLPKKLDAKIEEPRLIIPFIDQSGKCFGFQGRSFTKKGMRYISIMLDPSATKVFGLDRVNFNKQVYVLEGAIDSFFLDNACATAQGDLTSADHILKGRNCYIPDKDQRNPQIIRLIEKLIAQDKTVCLLPQDLPGKDLNQAVQNGIDPVKLKKIVEDHTFSGLRLQVEFNRWKKV